MTNHNKLIHHHKTTNHLLPPPSRTSNSTIQACAACRYQRRKCAPDCILAPYFPHDRQRQFQNAHKLFGVSNITKIIRNLDRPQKDEAMRTIIYQSDVRSIDPVGGCYRIIRELQRQIEISCAELEFVLQQLALYRTLSVQNNNQNHHHQQQFNHDMIVIDEIDYDIHLVNNPDEPQLYDDNNNHNNNNHNDNHDPDAHAHAHAHAHDVDLQHMQLQQHKDHNDVQYVVSDNNSNNNNNVAPPVIQSWSAVHENSSNSSPPTSQPLHASVCDDFKSLLINEIPGVGSERDEFNLNFKDADEPSEKSLFDEETQKALIKVENVCYNEEEYEIEVKNTGFGSLTDHKAIHVEGEYGS